MREAVIVEALRTPLGRGKKGRGDLSGFHPASLLGTLIDAVNEKSGLGPEDVEQVIGGCVTQAGEQGGNIIRHGVLARNKGWSVGGTTVDTQCGSSQQTNNMVRALVQAGSMDIGIAAGVEVMSRVGLGMNVMNGPGFMWPDDWKWDSPPEQFTAAQRIADKRGITRKDVDELAYRSQKLAKAARDGGRFKREIVPINAPIVDEDGIPTGDSKLVEQDQGIRDTTLEKLGELNSVFDEYIHTPGNSSQVTDGAAAVLWMTVDKAKELGLKPRARILQDVVVGADPYYLLDGPINATERCLQKAGMSMSDLDLYEVNEAFASVVLSWVQTMKADMDKLNVNGGAIALGHPVGATGARLIITALHELERQDKNTALITMCCGASVGTATIIERL
ncbi:MAG: steroid 3-ketoacyl-CoA thiolase [Polyangiaceae bacterium]|nr:steroid 3-ketoacyl-CoA thiolase [Polyangiaceae bacterium]